jgi:hypothetical protein
MKNLGFVLSLFFWLLPAHADSAESFSFQISGFQQACKRADVSKPFDCRTSSLQLAPANVTLLQVAPELGEKMAFEGSSGDLGMLIDGTEQHITSVKLRKSVVSVGGAGEVLTYELIFQVYRIGGASTVEYRTKIQTQDSLKVDHPILMPTDRYAPNERYFTQNIFQLKSN